MARFHHSGTLECDGFSEPYCWTRVRCKSYSLLLHGYFAGMSAITPFTAECLHNNDLPKSLRPDATILQLLPRQHLHVDNRALGVLPWPGPWRSFAFNLEKEDDGLAVPFFFFSDSHQDF